MFGWYREQEFVRLPDFVHGAERRKWCPHPRQFHTSGSDAVKRGTIFAIVFSLAWCAGIIWWLNPTNYLPSGELISEYDRQNITTHLFIGDEYYGPWQRFADVPYGEQQWIGYVAPAKYFKGYAELRGIESNWSGPVYSGDAPLPPPPEPIPPPKPGKGWGRGGKPK